MSGKGSVRRRGANDAKYREGWDRIFGKSTHDQPHEQVDRPTRDTTPSDQQMSSTNKHNND